MSKPEPATYRYTLKAASGYSSTQSGSVTLDQHAAVCAALDSRVKPKAALAADDLLASCKELLNCVQPDRDWNEAKRARAAIKKAEAV
jgi:hypothetical protein